MAVSHGGWGYCDGFVCFRLTRCFILLVLISRGGAYLVQLECREDRAWWLFGYQMLILLAFDHGNYWMIITDWKAYIDLIVELATVC